MYHVDTIRINKFRSVHKIERFNNDFELVVDPLVSIRPIIEQSLLGDSLPTKIIPRAAKTFPFDGIWKPPSWKVTKPSREEKGDSLRGPHHHGSTCPRAPPPPPLVRIIVTLKFSHTRSNAWTEFALLPANRRARLPEAACVISQQNNTTSHPSAMWSWIWGPRTYQWSMQWQFHEAAIA